MENDIAISLGLKLDGNRDKKVSRQCVRGVRKVRKVGQAPEICRVLMGS